MLYKEEFQSFNNTISPFEEGVNIVSLFTDSKRLLKESKYLIYNEVRRSPMSFYYSMFPVLDDLGNEKSVRLMFNEAKAFMTPVEMLQSLCDFKKKCYGELPVFIVMDFSMADSRCALHSFTKGICRAIQQLKVVHINLKLLFIMPEKSPFKVRHDVWIKQTKDNMCRKMADGSVSVFQCRKEAVDELRASIVFGKALISALTEEVKLDVDDNIIKNIEDYSTIFEEYCEVS